MPKIQKAFVTWEELNNLALGGASSNYYTKTEIDAFFEGETGGGKKKVDWASLTNKPSTYPPSSHASTHLSGGGDAIKLDDLATPDDNTDLDASLTRHGLMPKFPGGSTTFLRADGQWAGVTPGAHADTHEKDGEDQIYTLGDLTVDKMTIGAYYLNSLIANNKVPDSDKWDGYQFSDYLDQAVKQDSNVIFSRVELYNYAVVPQGIRGQVSGASDRYIWAISNSYPNYGLYYNEGTPDFIEVHWNGVMKARIDMENGWFYPARVYFGAYYLDTLVANNKVSDSDLWDGHQFATYINQVLLSTANVQFNQVKLGGSYPYLFGSTYLCIETTYGTTQIGMGNSSWTHFQTDASNGFYFGKRVDVNGVIVVYGTSVYLSSSGLQLGSYYLGALAANNKVQDSDKLDGYHHTTFLKLSGGTMTGPLYARNHGTGTTDEVINVCYGTSDTPPAVGGVTEGTIYIKHS